jgi:hypothetical protein
VLFKGRIVSRRAFSPSAVDEPTRITATKAHAFPPAISHQVNYSSGAARFAMRRPRFVCIYVWELARLLPRCSLLLLALQLDMSSGNNNDDNIKRFCGPLVAGSYFAAAPQVAWKLD